MILEKNPITFAEVIWNIKDKEESKSISEYLKKFSKLSKEEALKIKSDISALNNPKLKEENIIKIIDFLPKSSEELNRILIEASLSEEESNAILEIVRKY